VTEPELDVAIVGAGFGGLGMAIRLKQAGWQNFAVFEKADQIGGTWRDNSYPGCACDVPSHLYSFSFARNPDWSDTFSGQPEIWQYLRDCVARFGIAPHVRFNHAVEEMAWDDTEARWQITTSQGRYTAKALVLATGPLSDPSTPDIPGLESFTGTTFHSSRWRHDHDLTGRRVAVIGTGASAIQFVPEIQPKVGHLTLFQRTPPWVIPRRSRRITGVEKALHKVPGVLHARRELLYVGRELFGLAFLHPRIGKIAQRVLASRQLRRQVPDEALRARLTPDYVMGCKRVLISNDYYPALQQSNVDVVTDGIERVTPDGIVTKDGRTHPVDTIIFGTGFHVTDMPVVQHIRGREGVLLSQAWSPTMHAYRGTTVPGFPNLFILLGPNTGLGHTSVVLMIEGQVGHVLDVLRHQQRSGLSAVEPTAQAQDQWTRRVDRRMANTVWSAGGCRSWYQDATGRNSTLWPGYVTGFRLRLRRFQPTAYVAVAPRRRRVEVSS
jgi:cation diffusion facilitator CzcD-associated flavoprotein CzcO